jgi:hypothetical protein
MFSLFRYSKDGLPYGLIKAHDCLLEDIIAYFEKGKDIRKGIKEARKAVKKSLKLTKKKKINSLEKIEVARNVFKKFHEELEYTHKALQTTFINMEQALEQIEEERVNEPLALIENARDLCRKKEFEKAVEALKTSQSKIEEKVLRKTRTVLFGGLSNEVKNLKKEIEELRGIKAAT